MKTGVERTYLHLNDNKSGSLGSLSSLLRNLKRNKQLEHVIL